VPKVGNAHHSSVTGASVVADASAEAAAAVAVAAVELAHPASIARDRMALSAGFM